MLFGPEPEIKDGSLAGSGASSAGSSAGAAGVPRSQLVAPSLFADGAVGQKRARKATCTKCALEHDEVINFCGRCGTALIKPQQPPTKKQALGTGMSAVSGSHGAGAAGSDIASAMGALSATATGGQSAFVVKERNRNLRRASVENNTLAELDLWLPEDPSKAKRLAPQTFKLKIQDGHALWAAPPQVKRKLSLTEWVSAFLAYAVDCRDYSAIVAGEGEASRRCCTLFQAASAVPAARMISAVAAFDRRCCFVCFSCSNRVSGLGCRVFGRSRRALLRCWLRIHKPLHHDASDLLLHPDRLRVALLLDTIRCGANLGYDGSRKPMRVPPNHGSSLEEAKWLSEDFDKDLKSGRVLGWFDQLPFENLRCSPLAVVPKLDAGKPVGWRRILDCSAPKRRSLNDFINKIVCRCINFEAAVAMIADAGPGALLAKYDVDSAFRVVTVREDDLHLLGFHHLGKFAFDTVASFGARTSPPLWERVASLLNWVHVTIDGIRRCCHWVDDFLFCFPAGEDAKQQFAAALAHCERLGVPVKPTKTVWPCTSLVFAGFLFDTVTGMTEPRRAFVLGQLAEACGARRLTARQLQSLLGRLHFVARVLPAGKGFVNRLLSALRGKERRTRIRVTKSMRLDFEWWLRVLPQWSGVGLISRSHWVDSCDLDIFTDASSSFGMGGVFGERWFSEAWSDEDRSSAFATRRLSMPYLELRSLVRAAELWSRFWGGKRIRFQCDCLPVVYALNKGTTRMAGMAELLRRFSALSVENGFEFAAVHVAGVSNVIADLLSRDKVQEALQLMASTRGSSAGSGPGTLSPSTRRKPLGPSQA